MSNEDIPDDFSPLTTSSAAKISNEDLPDDFNPLVTSSANEITFAPNVEEIEKTEDVLQDYLKTITLNGQEEEQEPYVFSIFDVLDKPRILPDPVDLTFEHLKKIEDELCLIKLCWPKIETAEFEGVIYFPQSYLQNSDKEKVVLTYTENFRRQFCHNYPNRKPLFLAAENECGMQKMVCTTLRPTTVPFPEISSWKKCAEFLGDYFVYEQLEDPTVLPRRLYSPNTIFQRQKGECFELATALCSLLIGFGYDAYVVSGYAIRDITEKIMVRIETPFVDDTIAEDVAEEILGDPKYIVQPPRDLKSKFLQMLEDREKEKARLEAEKEEEAEKLKLLEEEKRPFDKYEGQRVHGWVLLKEGKDVEKSIFIEPSNGFSFSLDSDWYCGVESVWNHQNYWVNMQQCTEGLTCLEYDFTDVEKWEHLLIGEPIQLRRHKAEEIEDEEENKKTEMYEEKHLDMPVISWGMPISIPHEALKMRYPNGTKRSQFKRTIVEEFAPYVMTDGLVTRIARYKDFDCTELLKIEERYENRGDKLYKNILDLDTQIVTEFFHLGREDGVIKHTYYQHKESFGEFRIIDCDNRFDGLIKIETSKEYLTQHFAKREDFIFFRHVEYGALTEGIRREIKKIVQKFARNESIPFQEDIALREFNFQTRDIILKYHYGPSHITASTRDYQKPPPAEIGEVSRFHPELTHGYVSDIGAKQPKQLQLYLLLEQQMKDEEILVDEIRIVEKEILDFLFLRSREMAFPTLDVSLFNREQNIDNRMAMLQREAEKKLKQEKETEDEIEFLAPYLAKLGNPTGLSHSQAKQIRMDCLNDFKQLLVNRANIIQRAFDKTSEKLQQKQAWFTVNYDMLTASQVQDVMDEISFIVFVLHTLEMRLTRHRDLSPHRYEALVRYLDEHDLLRNYPSHNPWN